jgi:hypothetical protein
MQDKKQSFFNGHMVAIVRSMRGKSGKAVVTVKADNLPELAVDVAVEPETGED